MSALEELVISNNVKLVLADLVIDEYERNKEDVAKETAKRLSQEFKQVKAVVSEFVDEKQAKTIEVLNDRIRNLAKRKRPAVLTNKTT